MVLSGDVMKSALHARGRRGDGHKGRPKASGRRLAMAHAAAQFGHPHLVEMRPLSGDDLEFEPDLRGGLRLSEICRLRFGGGPAPLMFGLRILLDALSGLAALHGSSLG